MDTHEHPSVNPLLQVTDFDSNAEAPMKLFVVPSEEGELRFAIPAKYLDFINTFDGTRSVEDTIDDYLQRHPLAFTREFLLALTHKSLLTKGVLVFAHQDPARVAVSSQPNRRFLHIKLPLMKPGFVDPVAKALGFMYSRPALFIGILLTIITHVYAYGFALREQSVDFNELNVWAVAALMWLSTAGTIFHEFGHASAASHYGCRNMTIGWGLYLIYTVLWTNVSDAWKLPRQQRVMVDLGGVYFECMFLVLLLLAYLSTGNMVFLFAIVFIDLSMAANFNPFLRMDGYWLMSDMFGIVNLRSQQLLLAKNLLSRLFGGRNAKIEPTTLTPTAQRALVVYSALGMLFIGYIMYALYNFVILKVVTKLPDFLLTTWADLRDGATALEVLNAAMEVGWRVMMLVGVTLWLSRFAGRLLWLGGRIISVRREAAINAAAS